MSIVDHAMTSWCEEVEWKLSGKSDEMLRVGGRLVMDWHPN